MAELPAVVPSATLPPAEPSTTGIRTMADALEPTAVSVAAPSSSTLIGKSSPCGGSGFPLSLSEWCFPICPTPYNRK